MRGIRVVAGVVLLLGLASGAAVAQGRGRGRGREGAPGQMKKAEREQAARFAEGDREYARNWYYHEQRGNLPPGLQRRELPPGLRDRDRLPPGLERRLEPGYVFEPDQRPYLYPAPVVLVRRFAPPPPGYGYYLYGGNVVLVDAAFRLADRIRLDVTLVR